MNFNHKNCKIHIFTRMDILKHSLFLLFFITSVTCCGLSMPYGNMTQDYEIQVGDVLNIECSLYSNSIVYHNKTYSVSSRDLLLKLEADFLEELTITNDLMVDYTVQNASINDTGFYSCYVTVPELRKNILVCSTYIAVGYPPSPVQNFSCISYEYRNLTCSWVEPFNPVAVNYTLFDYLHSKQWSRPCGEILNETVCRWTMDSKPPYYRSGERLYFIMIGHNSLGKNEQMISLDHFKIVLPGVPSKILITNITQTSAIVSWLPPKYMEYNQFKPGLLYSVQYQPISPFRRMPQEIRRHSFGEGSVQIDLIPSTEYEIRVRCRSNASDDDNMWSPSVFTSIEAESDVPYLAPEIAPSSFEVENSLENRTINLYWKGIPAVYENGDDFQYVIQYHIHHVPSRPVRHTSEVFVGNKTLYSFRHMDTHSAYIFKIYAINHVGESLNTSRIIVDKSEKLLDKPKDIIVISYGQGRYNLTWKASNEKHKNFTLFWCKTLYLRPSECEGPLEWIYINTSKYFMELPDKKTSYQFAVSTNDLGATSGMSWASCIVFYKGAQYKVKKVELTPKNATSLKVQWSLECEAQKMIMKEYAVQYCEFKGTCSQAYSTKSCTDWKTVMINNMSKEEYILGSLKPYTLYLAFIQVRTLSGWNGNSNLACERTMSTAPSDPPGNVNVGAIEGKSIAVSFEEPKIPNGIVSRYVAFYNKSDGTSHHAEFRVKEISSEKGTFTVHLIDFMAYYTNYSIEIVACVDQACSQKSKPVYALTDISYPDIVNSPRIEVVDNSVNVSWDYPMLSNGPINYFQIVKDTSNSSQIQVFNVTGENFIVLYHNCTEKDSAVYNFRVRAVNIRNGVHLFGPYGKPTKTMLCSVDTPIGVIVGLAIGITLGIIALVSILYTLILWMKKEVDMIKEIHIELPKDLDSPMENPLSSYDKFKNGLQTNHDSGIPCDTSYERLCTFALEDAKDHGRVMEENSQKLKRKSNGRNNSGESTASGKCHDSISSSNTTKTHLSIDSGAEVDSSPSPDGLFSDTSSSHTTPRSYKPDLTIVRESSGSVSKDSGLDKEVTCPSFLGHNIDLHSKFNYFVKKKYVPYSNTRISNPDGQMPSYSKFAILGATNVPSFIPYGEQSLGLLDNHSLSNSEPSVADFDVCNGSEPLVLPGIQPYCKFGIARSAGNGLNISNQPFSINPKMGYSKFGTVYRALKGHDSSNIPTLCPKFLPHHPQTFTALTINNNPHSKQPVKDVNDKAYSKFGVSAPKKEFTNGYVTFKDILTYNSAENSKACGNQPYSKLGITPCNDKAPLADSDGEHVKENGVIINASDLQALPHSSRTSYVPFQNAKIMNLNDPLGKEGNNFSNPETEQSPTASPQTQTDKDNFVEDDDIDCIISSDYTPSLLDEITSDLGSKLKPTNFTISANNDSKGFLIEEERDEPDTYSINNLSNVIDALYCAYDVNIPNSEIAPIHVNLDKNGISVANPSTCPFTDTGASSLNNHTENKNFCKQCDNHITECTCITFRKDSPNTNVLCNGHSEPLANLPGELKESLYVPLGCNTTC